MITVHVQDKGVGIPEKSMASLFTYAFSTAKLAKLNGFTGSHISAPMAGFG